MDDLQEKQTENKTENHLGGAQAGVHKFYKKLGETPRECILRYKTDHFCEMIGL